MKNKNRAFLIILSINVICSLQSMYEVGGRGSGSEVLTEGFVSSWHTSAEIAEGNLEPRTTHTQSSPSEAAHEDEQARLLRIRQETAARDNSFEVIGNTPYEMAHQSDDLLSVSPYSGKSSPEMNDSAIGTDSHIVSPVRQDLNISPREREALLDQGLPQKNFAENRAWIEEQASKALDEGTAERKAAEKETQILQEKKVIQKDGLSKLINMKTKNKLLFQKMKLEIEKQIKEIEEDGEISEDEARAKEANLTRLLQEVTTGEITRMKEISDLEKKVTTLNVSSEPSDLRYSLNSSLNALSKKELSFYVNAEGETPEFYGKAPAINGYVIQEKPDGTILLWRTKSLNMGRRR